MLEKFKQLGRESLIYGVSGMLQKFIAVLLVPLYLLLFLPQETGQQSLVVTVVTLLSALAVLALDNAAHTWFWQTEDKEDQRTTIATWFWCQFTVATVLGGLLLVLAAPVSVWITGSEATAPLLRLAALTIPLNVTGLILTNYFRLQRRPDAVLYYAVGSSFLLVVLNLVFILVMEWGLSSFFLAQIAVGAASTILGLWLMHRTVHPQAARISRLREMLRFALPLMPAALGLWVVGLSDRLFIEKYLNTHEVGLYQAAASLATAVAMITGAFTTAWGPFALSQQRQPDAPALYARALLLYLALGGAVVAAVSLFAPEVLLLLAKSEYTAAAPVAGILCLGVLANGLATIASTGLALAKRSAPITAAVFLAAGVSVALNIALVPLFKKEGSAWASGISWLVYAGFIFARAQRIHPLPYDLRRALAIVALLIGIVVLAPRLSLESRTTALLLKSVTGCAFVAVLFTVALPGWPGMLRRALRPAA